MTTIECGLGADPELMVEAVCGQFSNRKLRLFALACCRRVWHLLQDRPVPDVEDLDPGEARKMQQLTTSTDVVAAADAGALVGTPRLDWGNRAAAAALATRWAVTASGGDGRSEAEAQLQLLRCICGSIPRYPVPQVWLSGRVTRLAQAIYRHRQFERIPTLASALEEAGCDDDDILDHLHSPGFHARGCWVVDWLLNKR